MALCKLRLPPERHLKMGFCTTECYSLVEAARGETGTMLIKAPSVNVKTNDIRQLLSLTSWEGGDFAI